MPYNAGTQQVFAYKPHWAFVPWTTIQAKRVITLLGGEPNSKRSLNATTGPLGGKVYTATIVRGEGRSAEPVSQDVAVLLPEGWGFVAPEFEDPEIEDMTRRYFPRWKATDEDDFAEAVFLIGKLPTDDGKRRRGDRKKPDPDEGRKVKW